MIHFIAIFFVLLCLANAGCPFSGSKDGECPFGALNPQPTYQGCVCEEKNPCGASIEEDAYNCDWCYTQGTCGNHGLKGRWDFCDYAANVTYESAHWSMKLDNLWTQVDADHTSGTYPNPLNLPTESIQTSFDNFADTMPANRKKYIHSEGAVCKFKMQINSASPFSGVFEAGSTAHGLIRMGSALEVDLKSGVIPGVGVKFLRTRVPSGNFVALNTLGPLPNSSYDFFELPLSNHIPAANTIATKVIAQKFMQASGCVSQVGLSDICEYNTDGKKTSKLVFPFKVVMNAHYTMPSTPITQAQLQKTLVSTIQPNAPLYTVVAYSDNKNSIVLGKMVTSGSCVNSAFGDAQLFFRHQLIEEDWAIRPDFMKFVDPEKDCGVSKISVTPPSQCNAKKYVSK